MRVNAESSAFKLSDANSQGSCTQGFATPLWQFCGNDAQLKYGMFGEHPNYNSINHLYRDLLNQATVNGQFKALAIETLNVIDATSLSIITYFIQSEKSAKTTGTSVFR
jgi:hypothetical protein